MIYKKIPNTCDDNWQLGPDCIFYHTKLRGDILIGGVAALPKFCSLYGRIIENGASKPSWCKARVVAVSEEDVSSKAEETICQIAEIVEKSSDRLAREEIK
jgi:hypothetical protein